jgi:biopolymer transport protein ExbB
MPSLSFDRNMRAVFLSLFLFLLVPPADAQDEVATPGSPALTTTGSETPGASLPEVTPVSVPADPEKNYTLYEQYFRGGFWMHPILICSFIGVAFALERLVNMRRSKVIPPAVLRSLNGDLHASQLEGIRKECEAHPSCLGRVILAGLERVGMPLAEMERVADEQSQRELYRLRRNSRLLGIVATIAPMFGLLGTVSGMIGAFDLVATHGSLGDPKMLSANIAVALLTTGFGLIVAIPALFLNHYFRGRADDLIVEISDISDHVFVRFEPGRQGESGSGEGNVKHET